MRLGRFCRAKIAPIPEPKALDQTTTPTLYGVGVQEQKIASDWRANYWQLLLANRYLYLVHFHRGLRVSRQSLNRPRNGGLLVLLFI